MVLRLREHRQRGYTTRRKTADELTAVASAIKKIGTMADVAREVNLTHKAVSKWKVNGVPARWVLWLANRSGVPKHRLRPDLYPEKS